MTISCNTIKDLLALYHDGVCSTETKQLVEEHLKTCESCQAELKAIQQTMPEYHLQQNLNEAEPIRNLSKTWHKGMLKSAFKGILFATVVIAAFFFILLFFAEFRFVPA